MPHAYMSYTRDDAEVADLLVAELQTRGHTVWRDTANIADGQDWGEAIEGALNEAYAVVVLISANAAKSDWVKREVEFASPLKPIVAVGWEEVDLPAHLADLRSVSFLKVQRAAGIEQLQAYRDAMNELVEKLDEARPLRLRLQELDHSNVDVRERAATELGEIGDAEACDGLVGALGDPDADVRFAAAASIGKLRCTDARKALAGALDDTDPDVAAEAADGLGVIGVEEGIEPLVLHLGHRDRFVREAVITSLGLLGASEAASTLVDLMRNDPISTVREAATTALCRIDSSVARRALRRSKIDCSKVLAAASHEQ